MPTPPTPAPPSVAAAAPVRPARASRTATGTATCTDRWRRSVREEPLLSALVVTGLVCALLPIWIGRYLPLLDYPNHLSMVFVWFHLQDPQWNFAPYYTLNLPPLPYWAHYGLVYALTFIVGTELAQKLFLSATVLLYPLALAVYARRMGRDPRLALLAFPLGWNFATANGFLSYVAGIPVMLLALAALDRHAERPSLRWGAIAALAGASLYFFHVLPWALFLLVGSICALMAPRPWTPARALVAPLPVVPAALIGIAAYRASRTEHTPFNPWNPQGLSGFEGVHYDLITNISGIPQWLINFHPGKSDEIALLVIALAWLLVLSLRGEGSTEAEARTDERSLRGWRLEVALVLVTLVFLWLPKSLMRPFYWYGVNSRLVVIIALLAVLLARGRITGARRIALAVGAAAGFYYCADLAAHFRRFNLRAHGFDEVMSAAPPHAQVLPIMLQLSDPDISVNAYNQWGSYVQMRQGGYMQFNFVSEFPVRYRRRLASPPWDHPEMFNFGLHGADWDYFVVRGPSKPNSIDPFANYHDHVRLVRKSGDWSLWEKVSPP